jgi:adenylate cyclase class IV/ADP-ribose pyrophosphatase YjhB (NUDIX family)
MARNVEIKVLLPSIDVVLPRVAALADSGPVELDQDDTFFPCAAGRLKLRAFSSTAGELIFYRRADEQGPRESFYVLAPTSTPDALRESLALAYGEAGRVRKHRTVFLVGRTRVHLDRVEHLGDFLELEVVLEDGEPIETGVRESQALMARLALDPSQLIEGAYVDLLATRATERRHPRYPLAVHLFLLRGDQILLLRRCNTGYEDGKLSVVAGHVEPGEPITAAAMREAREEVGISLAHERLHVVGVMHRRSGEERVDIFLTYALAAADGDPVNREPGKCSELLWVPLTELPVDTIPYVRAGIEGYRRGTWFQEFGWSA